MFKHLKDLFGGSDSSCSASHEDQRVVCVLKDGARVVRKDWMADVSSKGMGLKQASKNICNDNEQVRG
jgi:hypothetical protein